MTTIVLFVVIEKNEEGNGNLLPPPFSL
jgi:hypothetical protein